MCIRDRPYFAFSQQLLKAVARLEKRAKHYLTVPVEGGLRRLDTASTVSYTHLGGAAASPP